jgi:hypothetical protein
MHSISRGAAQVFSFSITALGMEDTCRMRIAGYETVLNADAFDVKFNKYRSATTLRPNCSSEELLASSRSARSRGRACRAYGTDKQKNFLHSQRHYRGAIESPSTPLNFN